MTVEKAIEILSDVGDINRCCAEDAEALDMAIKALEQQQRDCNTCKHSDNGKCAYTEECHECMWKSKYEQQPCDDCISREAVDEYITNLLSGYLYDEERTRLEDLTTYIWELPSVTPKAERWIPCTERLPEDYEDVLVCDRVDMFVGWCEFDGLSKKWHSLDDNYDYDTPIIAWMPLPQPYKAESEDKE